MLPASFPYNSAFGSAAPDAANAQAVFPAPRRTPRRSRKRRVRARLLEDTPLAVVTVVRGPARGSSVSRRGATVDRSSRSRSRARRDSTSSTSATATATTSTTGSSADPSSADPSSPPRRASAADRDRQPRRVPLPSPGESTVSRRFPPVPAASCRCRRRTDELAALLPPSSSSWTRGRPSSEAVHRATFPRRRRQPPFHGGPRPPAGVFSRKRPARGSHPRRHRTRARAGTRPSRGARGSARARRDRASEDDFPPPIDATPPRRAHEGVCGPSSDVDRGPISISIAPPRCSPCRSDSHLRHHQRPRGVVSREGGGGSCGAASLAMDDEISRRWRRCARPSLRRARRTSCCRATSRRCARSCARASRADHARNTTSSSPTCGR